MLLFFFHIWQRQCRLPYKIISTFFVLIKIKTKNSEFAVTNVKFNYIQFNDESMVLYFDKCSFEIDNINDILHIDSIDNLPLKDCIEKSFVTAVASATISPLRFQKTEL